MTKTKAAALHRSTAERMLDGVLKRVAEVNAPSSPFAYRVESLWVFGSYLKEAASERPRRGAEVGTPFR